MATELQLSQQRMQTITQNLALSLPNLYKPLPPTNHGPFISTHTGGHPLQLQAPPGYHGLPQHNYPQNSHQRLQSRQWIAPHQHHHKGPLYLVCVHPCMYPFIFIFLSYINKVCTYTHSFPHKGLILLVCILTTIPIQDNYTQHPPIISFLPRILRMTTHNISQALPTLTFLYLFIAS